MAANKLLVLIIEPDARERAAFAAAAREAGYETEVAADSGAGMRLLFASHPDVIVLNLELPDAPGWEVVSRVRELAETPIIVTAAEAGADALQRGFDLRVDGFLVKPFGAKELTARLNAVRERIAGRNGQERWLYQRNGLVIDWRSCEVFVEGQTVGLTGTEFRLLEYLVQRRGWVLSHDQILAEVWGPEYTGERGRLKLYVWYLRQKIEKDPGHPQLVLTKRGLGYTFAG